MPEPPLPSATDDSPDEASGLCRVPAPADFVPFPGAAIEQSIADRFEALVQRGPARVAVAAPQGTLTYAQLNARANGVAAVVLAAGGRRDVPVAVLLDHGPAQVAGILGVLKAACAYVGLDPRHEPEGHLRILALAGAGLLVCDAASRNAAQALAAAGGQRIVDIDGAGAAPRDDDPALPRSPDDPAYIYFTSGTTGVPKGVIDNQRNVLHNVMRYTNHLGIAPSDRLSLLQSVAFSGAVSSLFGALLNGATSLPVDLRRDGLVSAAAWLDAQGATIYHSVPSIFERMLGTGARFDHLRVIRLEGDLAAPRHVQLFRRHFAPGVVLVNGLGATETGLSHQFVCRHDTLLDSTVVPVGRPCAGMRGLVVDEAGVELPRGAMGEVAVRSRHLALGYWGQPGLTAMRFSGEGDERTYRTGDLGRYSPAGDLELLGRVDGTRKLNGRWVDLQAAEAALARVAGVREAVVQVHEGTRGGGELVAYVVPQTGTARPEPAALRAALAAASGTAAARLAWLEALPLDANGKVQRGALPLPPRERPALSTPWAEPATATEQAVAAIWRDVLELDAVGAHDDFAELGGDSLQAIDIVTRAEARFGLVRQAQRLIEAPTVASMAGCIEALLAAAGASEPAGAAGR